MLPVGVHGCACVYSTRHLIWYILNLNLDSGWFAIIQESLELLKNLFKTNGVIHYNFLHIFIVTQTLNQFVKKSVKQLHTTT